MSIIHSDDILSPNYVQSALAVIDKSPNISAFNVELTEINEEGIATGDLQSSIWTCSDRVNRLLASGLNSGVMPGSIIKLNSVSSFMKTEFPSQLNGNEDTLLWLSILRSGGKIRKVPLNIYFYRRHPKQTTNSSDAFAFSLGYSRRFNIITSRNFVEKLLALSEIRHEFDYVKNRNYLHGLSLNRPFTFSKFRVFSVVLRRISKFIRWICKYQSK